MTNRLLTLTATQAEALRWFLEQAPTVVAENRRDGFLRPVEARAMEGELLAVRHSLLTNERARA